ncbi:hypothetical protein J2752_001412 [Halarchaeum rubridurum]|uniref:C2H2-type domain-containing protein n=1 Tax=Halarchaeum rubridurum TaxID=489911 RepID=A0A830FU44_9EURY|nr:hypothetical protein [Halarchaeum rubridurum]MBP1954500.1 hypothetical protein [Halarchaeum rubridurum]GGM61603.1 hypothetical protein GCM10009017_09560 [Halarchaeum rubridurum]
MATATVGDVRCAVCDTDFAVLDDLFEHDCDDATGRGLAVADD